MIAPRRNGPLQVVRGVAATPSPGRGRPTHTAAANDHSACAPAYCSVTWQRRRAHLEDLEAHATLRRAAALLDPHVNDHTRPVPRRRAQRWLAARARLLLAFPYATAADYERIVRQLLWASHDVIDSSAPLLVAPSVPTQLTLELPGDATADLSALELLQRDVDRLKANIGRCPSQPIPPLTEHPN